MNALLQALYTYTYENRMTYTKEEKLQYGESRQAAEQAQKDLLDMLPEKGRRPFEEYHTEVETQQLLELGSIFRAGLSIGLELSRL